MVFVLKMANNQHKKPEGFSLRSNKNKPEWFSLRSNKRGQFYLIAAVVIILIILGFYEVRNTITSNNNSDRVHNLRDELNLESAKVVDYGIYNQKSDQEINALLEDFAARYVTYAGQGKNIYFVIGDRTKVKIISYEEVLQSQDSTDTSPLVLNKEVKEETKYNVENVSVKVGDEYYGFDLKEGRNFDFVIVEDTKNGRNVAAA